MEKFPSDQLLGNVCRQHGIMAKEKRFYSNPIIFLLVTEGLLLEVYVFVLQV